MESHIYHEGACRPGFLCDAKCTKYTAQGLEVNRPSLSDEQLAEHYLDEIRREQGKLNDWESAVVFDQGVREAYLAGLQAGRAQEREAIKPVLDEARQAGCYCDGYHQDCSFSKVLAEYDERERR